ncbi:MAG: FAD-dependent oxidoreductase [Chromatiaceae bacterium]|nr:FAD-dependent oxidoreductase [Chromatiaceae bacterium]
MSQDFDHLIIGAGISGLGAAHFSARRGLSTLVLEANERVGGCINSQRFDDLGGFWVEAGGHTCFNSYGNLLDILDDLGLTEQVQPKLKVGYRLWKDGARRSITSALHLGEALASLPRLFSEPKAGRRVADYYSRVLGQRNYEDLLRYAFQAVICQPADDYPAEALFRKKPRRKEVIKAFTFNGGLSSIAEAIAAGSGIEVRTAQRVGSIAHSAEGFEVRIDGGKVVRARHLTLAVPPPVAAGLLPEGFEAARVALDGMEMAEIETLVLVARNTDLARLKPIAGLIAIEDAFYSAVSRDFLPDPAHRGFAFHFRPGALDAEAQRARACQTLDLNPAQIVAECRVHNRLPVLRPGHAERIARLDAALAGTPLAMTGNWFLGVSMEDALTRSRAESDRLFGAPV